MCFICSLGKKYSIDEGSYTYHNLLNPFYHLDRLVPAITQFRCIGRFFWISFWAWSLAFIFLVDRHLQLKSSGWLKVIIAGLLILMTLDVKDFIIFHKKHHFTNEFNLDKYTQGIQLPDDIDTDRFQALLPVPMTHVSSKVYEYVLDGGIHYNAVISLFSLRYDIPLIGGQSSRQPLTQTKHAFPFSQKKSQITIF